MPRRLAPHLLIAPVLAAALAVQSCAKPTPELQPVASENMPANAIAVTFGRCEPATTACPGPVNPKAVGDRTLQSTLVKCIAAEVGRPVYALGDAPAPAGYW